jgi:hypothetical protein
MSAMVLLNLVLMMMRRTMINREAPKEIEDKLRLKLKLDRVLLIRLSWTSLWLSASMELSTLRLGRRNPSELETEPKVRTRIPNMWVQGGSNIDFHTDHRGSSIQASRLRSNRRQGKVSWGKLRQGQSTGASGWVTPCEQWLRHKKFLSHTRGVITEWMMRSSNFFFLTNDQTVISQEN